MIVQILLLISTLLLSAFFSASETAYTSLSQAQLYSLSEKKGQRIRNLLSTPGKMLATVLIGNTVANIIASVITTKITIEYFGSTALAISTGILTLFILFFSELVPKQIAIIHNERIAMLTLYPLIFLSWIVFPFIKISSFFSRLLSRSAKGTHKTLTIQGLLSLVAQAEETGILSSYHSSIINNSLQLSKLTVSSIMTHRLLVQSLEHSTTINEFLLQMEHIPFSRIPLYEKNAENIIGIVHIKSILRHANNPTLKLAKIMYQPLYISDQKSITVVLNRLLSEKQHMTIVLDEFGGLAGIVTLEDILEEIIGQVDDEYETPSKKKIVPLKDGSFIVQANISLTSFSSITPQPLGHIKKVGTLGGFLLQHIGRIPGRNDHIHTNIGDFEILSLAKNRISQVIYRPAKTQ